MAKRVRRLPRLSVNSLIPNILTLLALCAGVTAIRFSLEERWEAAVAAIIVAAILDGLDGRMARLLKGASKFGAELDSLSDFAAFGVAPAVTLYLWSTHEIGGVGWMAALAFAACCALRLARFNTALEEVDPPPWRNLFFTGLAAPAGALLAMMPVAVSFQIGDEIVRSPVFVGIWLIVGALLMVSQVPTYSFKRLRVKREHVLPLLILVAFLAALLFTYPWLILTLIGLAYLCSFPFSYRAQRRYAAATAEAGEGTAGAAEATPNEGAETGGSGEDRAGG